MQWNRSRLQDIRLPANCRCKWASVPILNPIHSPALFFHSTTLELEPKPVKSSTATYTWAQYFGITFIVALAFGLLIPVLFLVGIIVVCRRRHAYRHHHCMTNGSGGSMSVGGAGSGSYGNSKLFSANLWHYIGGKEVADDPFAEHTASIHRPPFSAHKFSDGTLGMRGDGTLDLPDVVIPSGACHCCLHNSLNTTQIICCTVVEVSLRLLWGVLA